MGEWGIDGASARWPDRALDRQTGCTRWEQCRRRNRSRHGVGRDPRRCDAGERSRGGRTMPIAALSGWTREQRNVVAASFLGWDARCLRFLPPGLCPDGHRRGVRDADPEVTFAILLTLVMRPVGAFLFGR